MPQPPSTIRDPRGFPTTRWTLVQAIEVSDGEARSKLLGDFLERYRPALAAHLVYAFRGLSPEDRADVLQSFILDKLICSRILAHATESRGRLRNFLKTSLSNYAADWMRRADNRFNKQSISFEPQLHDTGYQSRHTETFEVAWARQVVNETVARFHQDVEARNRQSLRIVFEHRILKPAIDGAVPTSIERLCEMINAPPKRVYNLVITARRNFSRHLKDVVSEYAADDQDVEGEIRDLLDHLNCGSDE